MSAGRFFVAPEVLATPEAVTIPPAIASQVRSVLRLRVDDTITLLDGTGNTYQVTITLIERDRMIGRVIGSEKVNTEPQTQLILYQALLKAAKFEWIVQKGTEIGIAEFIPVLSERSTSGLAEASATKLNRWRTIATEAAEQSDRGRVPYIHEPQSLHSALVAIPADEPALFAWEDAMGESTIRTALQHFNKQPQRMHLFIGPEGGFSAQEADEARAAGARLVTLGPRILRAETAAIVATTLALDTLGELG